MHAKVELIFKDEVKERKQVVLFADVTYYKLEEGTFQVQFGDENILYVYPLHTISRIKIY